jgi:DNA-binding LacI/PurR family transcriptional regulator
VSDRPGTTQQDLITAIAAECGVSVRTVIRVMTEGGGTRPKARARAEAIRAAADARGYRPNAAAQAMSARRHGAVALLSASDIPAHVTPETMSGIMDALAEHGQRLVLARSSQAKLTGSEALPSILRQHACDGMLVNNVRSLGRVIDAAIKRYAIPCIHFNFRRANDSVCHADHAAGGIITRQLLSAGHRHIGYLGVSTHPHRHTSEVDRAAGCAAALAAEHLPFDERLIETELYRDTGGVEPTAAVEAVLRAWNPRPTAIVAYEGRIADLFCLAAARLGWRIPQDISLTTVVSTDFSVAGHRYSGIRLAEWKLGASAVEMLLAKIADPTRTLPTRLVSGSERVGDTVAPWPA